MLWLWFPVVRGWQQVWWHFLLMVHPTVGILQVQKLTIVQLYLINGHFDPSRMWASVALWQHLVQFKMVYIYIYICALRKAHMYFTLSLRSFLNDAFETVPMFVWLMLALSRPFKEDCLVLPLSTPPSSRRSMMWCPWLWPGDSVLGSSTLQVLQDTRHLWWLLCLPVHLLSHFPHSGVSRAVNPQEFLKVDVDHWHIPVRASHSTFHFL